MRHEVNGVVEHEGEQYSYYALLWTTEDSGRGDEVAEIEPLEGDIDEFVENHELYEKVADLCLNDAHVRLRYLCGPESISSIETIGEYYERLGGSINQRYAGILSRCLDALDEDIYMDINTSEWNKDDGRWQKKLDAKDDAIEALRNLKHELEES